MRFPIVAIVPRGLEAITELLGALPSISGMAYIAVQHLNPDHESLLSEILTNHFSAPPGEGCVCSVKGRFGIYCVITGAAQFDDVRVAIKMRS
jgi:CheB methylesterase